MKLLQFFVLALTATLTQAVQKCKPRAKGSSEDKSDNSSDCSDETLLDTASFPNYVTKGSGAWLVFFMTTWCPFCQKLLPEWKAVNSQVLENGPYGMGIARFDCTDQSQKQFCHNNGVKKYPNVRLYLDGEFIEKYVGERTTGAIMDYIQKKAVELKLDAAQKPAANALPPIPVIQNRKDSTESEKVGQSEPQQKEPPAVKVEEQHEPPVLNEPPVAGISQAAESPKAPQPPSIKANEEVIQSTSTQTTPPTTQTQPQDQCPLSWSSPISCHISKFLSLIVLSFGAYKLYQPFFSIRRPNVPLITPFLLDASASSLVFVYCLRNGFHVSTFAELALYAVTGVYVCLAGWEFSANHGGGQLRVMSVVFTFALMTGMWVLPGWISNVSPYVASLVIYLNRFVVQKRKPGALPVRKGGVVKGVAGMNLDFA
ncbi:Thioredoxin domain-containing protein 5, partial [Rhizoclosmatium hyalinum]